MRELGQELWLLVVLKVNVVFREVHLQTGESSGRADLSDLSKRRIHVANIIQTYTPALGLLRDGVKRSERHF